MFLYRDEPLKSSSGKSARNRLRLLGAWPLALEVTNFSLQVLDLVHHSCDPVTKGAESCACMICGFLCAVSKAHRDGDVVANGRDGAVHPVYPTDQVAAQLLKRRRMLLLPFLQRG